MSLVYKNEKPLFWIAAFISLLLWLAFIIGTVGVGLIYLLLIYIIFLFAHSGFIAYIKGSGVKITEAQFPDLHQRLVNACQQLGVDKVPDAYVLRTDFFNALATRFLGRNFLVLFSDVIDALEDRPDAVDFYIGHELGHIHRKHLLWAPFLFPAAVLPVLGFALRRAEEYTCDRYGAACTRHLDDANIALAAMAAGDTRWKQINMDAYRQQVQDTKGFWMSFHEFTSDYPWLTKRAGAVQAFKTGESITQPRRSFWAGVFALFVPRLGGGSSVVSVMITVVIIGILAAVAMPAYQDYTQRTKYTEIYNKAVEVQHKANAYIQSHGELPGSLYDLGYQGELILVKKPNYTLEILESGVIAASVGETAMGDEQYLYLTPLISEESIEWECSAENILPRHLPPACR